MQKFKVTPLVIVSVVLFISLVFNVVLGLVAYGGYQFRNSYIFTEEFSVIAMQDVSRKFCVMFEREYPDINDEIYAPYCEKVLEIPETDSLEINGEIVELD